MRRGLVVGAAAVLAALALNGCGHDPVRADLEVYEREVLRPLAAEEARGAEALDGLARETASGRLELKEASGTLRKTLIPRYQELLALLEAHPPVTPEVAALHARLTVEYRAIATDLQKAGEALERPDWHQADALLAGLAGRGFERVRADFSALARAHGLDPAAPR